MSDFSQAIENLPHAGLIPVGLFVVVGLLLWAAGRRVLKAAVASVGFLLGSVLGWGLTTQVSDQVPAVIGAVLLGITLACLFSLLSRLAVTIALALVMGVAAPLAVALEPADHLVQGLCGGMEAGKT